MSRPPTDTEARLFDGALTLFATQGYAATSVREIIEAVGLTKPVLYYYCRNKVDLFEKLIARVHTEAQEGLEEVAKGDAEPIEKLRAILLGTFAFCAADWRVPRIMYAAACGPSIPEIDTLMKSSSDRRYALVREVIEEGIADGSLAPQHPDVLALGFCSLMDHPVNLLTRDPSHAERLTPELAECLFSIFAKGARAD